MSKETLSNDSTKKQLGFEYQKLIALEHCLNAKNGEHVYIECFGDVQYDNESIEVKHHEGESNLTSNSVDVWKTLKNLVLEYDRLKSNDRFILHTTQRIQSDSIFYDWNSLKKDKKYTKLKDQSITASSKPFKDIIFDTKIITKNNLLEILDKFQIKSNEPKVAEKLNQLKEHATFKLIAEELRGAAIGILVQWITERAIDNSDKWEINITDFNRDLQFSLRQFTTDKTPFPSIDKIERDDSNLEKEYKFIKNLNAISLKKQDLHQAFEDYVRSEGAYEELIVRNPTLADNLIVYESDITTEIATEKSHLSYSLSEDSFLDNSHIEKSRDVYFKCIKREHNQIKGVSDTQKYYRNGRIHNIIETTDFEWLFSKTDI
ncbi:hypothetical protein [Sphingobacterium tabacisoli]|uniref:CD-NTase associated protein 4-like DNA endonuclease domain-containing protein n=1 Tax=Sphingobacterium tabacisoli TaxID=2044855 RepID=A0ABW5L5L5_9SPHI|nr:hypothetical protein [Sphingobacterium tabacisoli]